MAFASLPECSFDHHIVSAPCGDLILKFFVLVCDPKRVLSFPTLFDLVELQT